MWKTSQNLKILKGITSNKSESMTIREGKIRETNELSYRSYAERSRGTSGKVSTDFAGSQGEATIGEARW